MVNCSLRTLSAEGPLYEPRHRRRHIIQAVLLADGWHTVHNASFTLDAYEYLWSGRPSVKVQNLENERDARLLHEGGDSGISSTGFAFATDESGTTIAGPLSAVLAVRYHV